MKLFLIRHGQTTGDVEDRYGGTYDDHLTNKGKQQARQLAQQLAEKGIEAIYVSPYHRAQETATVLAEKLGIKPETIAELRERNGYGILSGMVKAEAKQKYPDQVALLKDIHNTVEGGEPYDQFAARFTTALDKLVSGQYGTIAVLTHGGPISQFFRDVLKQGEVSRADCSYAELVYEDGQYRIVRTTGIVPLT